MATYKDIIYELGENAVRITINRPDVYNAFRLQTVEELIQAFQAANEEHSVNAVVVTGAGEKAFCTGGDQKSHLTEDGLYGARGTVGMPIAQPRPIRTAHTADGWTPETILDRVLPMFANDFYPLHRSGDIFTWDPV